MSTPVRIAAFAMVLAIVYLGAFAVGSLVGPLGDEPVPSAPAGGVDHG